MDFQGAQIQAWLPLQEIQEEPGPASLKRQARSLPTPQAPRGTQSHKERIEKSHKEP